MKQIVLLIALLLAVTGAGLYEVGVQLSLFEVKKDQSDLVVEWKAQKEEGVRQYEILRKSRASNNVAVKVASVNPHGVEKPYQYRDDQVFKSASEDVTYQLWVVYQRGDRQQLAEKNVNYTSTAIRRTWGSIKAMWQ